MIGREMNNKAVLFILLVRILLILSVFSGYAFGQWSENTYWWVASYGNWSTPENWEHMEWDPDIGAWVPVPGVPSSGDGASILNGGEATNSSGAYVENAFVENKGSVLSVIGGGSLGISELLSVDWDASFEQSGGQVSATNENVGSFGTGTFIQTGGTNTTYAFHIGFYSGSNGIYELSGNGHFSAHAGHVARYGNGTFIQTGGMNTIQDWLAIGFDTGSNGTYELSGNGELSTFRSQVGRCGTGTFTQTGGSHDAGLHVSVGGDEGGYGTYNLENGTITTTYLGMGGTNATGTFNLSGGEIEADAVFVGCGGEGYFNQTGGDVTVDTINLPVNPPGVTTGIGIYEMLDGGNIYVAGFISIKEGGSFIMNEGNIISSEDADLTVEDGGSLTGPGTFNIDVVYQSKEIYGTYGDDSVDVIFGRNCLQVGGAYNVNQLTPADFAGGTLADLLQSSVFDVSFDGDFSGEFTIHIPYDEADIAPRLDEDDMRLHILHQTGPDTYELLEDVQIDTTENIVYGRADSFGKFALSGDPFLIFDVAQPPVENICQVAPASLTLKSINGHIIYTWQCFSGAREVLYQEVMTNNFHFANWKNVGPIPSGLWRVGAAGSGNPDHPTWYPLYSVDGTQTYSRTGFYIHGSTRIEQCTNKVGQSQGCVAIMPGEYDNSATDQTKFRWQFENAPNVSDALSRSELLLYVDNFTTQMYPLPEPYPYVEYSLYSPANLFLQTETQHVCGYDPELGQIVNDIDGASYSGPGTHPQILIYSLLSTASVIDNLTLIPVGAGGSYELEVSYRQIDGSILTAQQAGEVFPGKPVEYFITLAPDAITIVPSEPTTIIATIDIAPDTLSLGSEGNWVTCYIEIPGHDVANIKPATVMLVGAISAKDNPTAIGDNDQDGIPDLMVKFDRSNIQNILQAADAVEITVSGELTDGTLFEGSDTIRVIN